MLLAYFDDSGEAGTILLAAVVVDEQHWLETLDAWADYRRWLRADFGFPIAKGSQRRSAVELHATDFATGGGAWYGLRVNRAARMRALKVGLKLIGRQAAVFAVAFVPEREMSDTYREQYHRSPAIDCWITVLERLAVYSQKSAGAQRVIAIGDKGYGPQFARELRRMRRYHRVGSLYGGSLMASAPMLLDDPVARDSKESAFVQMADLCAYAALRELRPRSGIDGLWQAIGGGVVRDVNVYQHRKGQPPGIKLIPP